MNIAFVTENQFTGKVSPHYTNRRTEFEWMINLDAVHYNWEQVKQEPNILKDHDITIFVLPKTKPEHMITLRKSPGKKILMQEGPCYFWQEYPVQLQIEYYKLLNEVDAVFCHNKLDKNYFSNLTSKPVYIMPTMINVAFVQNIGKIKKEEGTVLIGGTSGNWYNGVSSAAITKDIPEIKEVCFPSMGRKQPNEEIMMSIITNKKVGYIPYMNWDKFTQIISRFEYAIHLMPTPAAGSFHAQCAAMGIPCIGPKNIDTQRILFPELCVDSPYDLEQAKQLLEKLVLDKVFYKKVVSDAKVNLDKFSVVECTRIIEENIQEVLNK